MHILQTTGVVFEIRLFELSKVLAYLMGNLGLIFLKVFSTFEMTSCHLCLVVFLMFTALQSSSGCDGFKVKLKSITNCGDDKQIVKVSKNSSVIINDKCEVFSNTCADVQTYANSIVSCLD